MRHCNAVPASLDAVFAEAPCALDREREREPCAM